MVDWKDPAVLAKCASLFADLSHITSGAYAMEIVRASVYDYEILTRKRPWKWGMLASTRFPRYWTILLNAGLEQLYLIAKWSMFFCAVALLLVIDIDYPINCQVYASQHVPTTSPLTNHLIGTVHIRGTRRECVHRLRLDIACKSPSLSSNGNPQ